MNINKAEGKKEKEGYKVSQIKSGKREENIGKLKKQNKIWNNYLSKALVLGVLLQDHGHIFYRYSQNKY